MTAPGRISVIIPTLAEASRSESLKRAIASIRASTAEAVQIITVVNGSRFDGDLCAWLGQQPDVVFDQIREGSSPLAQKRGRALVNTEYFSFLDDDDEYLPGATDRKLETLCTNPATDFVLCNGYWGAMGQENIFYPRMTGILEDPLAALFRQNWLTSCNALFRTSSIPGSFFNDPHPYAEWTWLAFTLCMANKRFALLDEPGFHQYPTPGSLSKSRAYNASYIGLYERILDASPPESVAGAIRMRISSAWHVCASDALASGEWLDALCCHIRSLLQPGGLRYLSYSRRLLPGWPKS